MEQSAIVALPKLKHEWKRETFSQLVRAMNVGDHIVVEPEYTIRQSKYLNAKRSFPGATFSIKKQEDGRFHLIRKS